MPKCYRVRNSAIHGKGVFATRVIPKGERILEYKGQFIDNDEADRRWPRDPNDPFHTFYFSLSVDSYTIDASVRGNAARWINHHCRPNCETEEVIDEYGKIHVYIKAKRAIADGEELNYDYRLQLDGKITKQDKKNYQCLCGAKKCRGTMLDLD